MRTNSCLSTSSGQFDSNATPTQNGFHEPSSSSQQFSSLNANNKSNKLNIDLNNNQINNKLRQQQVDSIDHNINFDNNNNTNSNQFYEDNSDIPGMPSSLTTVETIPRSVLAPAYQVNKH